MKKMILTIGIIVSIVFIGNFVHAGLTPDQKAQIKHISAQQALILFQQKRIILIDVHERPGKKQASVLGAIYIPRRKLIKGNLKIPNGKIIGLY